MKQLGSVLVALAALSITVTVRAGGAIGAVSDSTVKFEARGPAGLKINGEAAGIKASEADGKLRLTAPTTQFHTGIGLRDKHLREAIDAEKHPEATLVVDKSAIKLPGSGTASGAFTFHGVTRPTSFSYSVARQGDGYRVHGDFSVNIGDFQIKKPCYLGVCVGEVVKVAVDFTVHGS